ncbi:uncharacterized protein BCR38DRAFT_216561 [Pseudomassariella vexata]|uniref:Uncharacterized protein n=1 Tax=Pseudomassariella vexata TaxID=1141098 RepID=A0A1Y2DUD4_9PEZI|nr:uncharacterized protein BCR38DRAFT_216561 [Pseudomassariella vexata]ORY62883.1 hypothetical protein BCR38DRAFT_216561 [Pseudomassariella vexata]
MLCSSTTSRLARTISVFTSYTAAARYSSRSGWVIRTEFGIFAQPICFHGLIPHRLSHNASCGRCHGTQCPTEPVTCLAISPLVAPQVTVGRRSRTSPSRWVCSKAAVLCSIVPRAIVQTQNTALNRPAENLGEQWTPGRRVRQQSVHYTLPWRKFKTSCGTVDKVSRHGFNV